MLGILTKGVARAGTYLFMLVVGTASFAQVTQNQEKPQVLEAAPVPPPPSRETEQDRLRAQGNRDYSAGKLDSAIDNFRKALELDRASLGERNAKLDPHIESLAGLYQLRGDWKRAVQTWQELVALRQAILEKGNWRTKDAQFKSDHASKAAALRPEQLRLLQDADKQLAEATKLEQKDPATATAMADKARSICEQLFGVDDLQTLKATVQKGFAQVYAGQHSQAISLLEQAQQGYERLFGDIANPYRLALSSSLGPGYYARGDYAKAAQTLRKAINDHSVLHSWNPNDPEYIRLQQSYAQAARASGDYREARQAYSMLLSSFSGKPNVKDFQETLRELAELGRKQAKEVGQQQEQLNQVIEEQIQVYENTLSALSFQPKPDLLKSIYAEIVAFHTECLGANHWRTLSARIEQQSFQTIQDLPNSIRASLQELENQERSGRSVEMMSRFNSPTDALSRTQSQLQVLNQVFGSRHPEYANGLSLLGMVYRALGDYQNAEASLQQALDIRTSVLGADHPQTALCHNNLALTYFDAANTSKAIEHMREAVAILQKQLGPKNRSSIVALNNLAVMNQRLGNYEQARRQLLQTYHAFLESSKKPRADRFREMTSLSALTVSLSGESNWSGSLSFKIHAAPEAGASDSESEKRRFKAEQARLLNNLARSDMLAGDLTAAIEHLREAQQNHQYLLTAPEPPPSNTPNVFDALMVNYYSRSDHATCLNNLALAYMLHKDYQLAKPVANDSLDLREKEYGLQHPSYALGLNTKASLLAIEGNLTESEKVYQRVIELQEGANRGFSATALSARGNLAIIRRLLGNQSVAAETMLPAMRRLRSDLLDAAAVQSEQEQLAMVTMLRGYLDTYLAAALQAKLPAADIYAPVLAWKGSVCARQRRIRERSVLEGSGNAAAVQLLVRIDEVNRRLGSLTSQDSFPMAPSSNEEIDALTLEREGLEVRLASLSKNVQEQREADRLTPDQLRSVLPSGVVLIDFLEYSVPTISPDELVEHRLAAFIVAPAGEIIAVDLGPIAPVNTAAQQWHEAGGRMLPGATAAAGAVELRKLVWEPLQPYIKQAKTVLIAPDGSLGKIPFAALPGVNPDSYLLEEFTFAVLPVPQDLPRILALDRAADAKQDASLLIVGDVDYGAPPAGSSGPTRSLPWAALPGTRLEMLAIRDTFEQRYPFPDGQVHALRGDRATEEAFRSQATKHRYLHLGTHGYFMTGTAGLAADSRTTALNLEDRQLAPVHPGLKSGIVLSAANLAPAHGQDDGVLTALEIAQIDLNSVDLAALSACDSGLGQSIGGEGMISLQRSFHVAGARSVVASLWKVDDSATRQLMVDFYSNLWQKKMSKADALREAQKSMLCSGYERGVVRQPETDAQKKRVPPFYWAPFVLSGDWR